MAAADSAQPDTAMLDEVTMADLDRILDEAALEEIDEMSRAPVAAPAEVSLGNVNWMPHPNGVGGWGPEAANQVNNAPVENYPGPAVNPAAAMPGPAPAAAELMHGPAPAAEAQVQEAQVQGGAAQEAQAEMDAQEAAEEVVEMDVQEEAEQGPPANLQLMPVGAVKYSTAQATAEGLDNKFYLFKFMMTSLKTIFS